MNLSNYIERNYDELRRYASAFTRDPNDLIHHTFIKMHNAGLANQRAKAVYFENELAKILTDFYKSNEWALLLKENGVSAAAATTGFGNIVKQLGSLFTKGVKR